MRREVRRRHMEMDVGLLVPVRRLSLPCGPGRDGKLSCYRGAEGSRLQPPLATPACSAASLQH